MRKLLGILLAISLLLTVFSFAEENQEVKSITVASPSRLTGRFFTDIWGNNTSDIDVRMLLHGLNTVSFDKNQKYAVNSSVVSKLDGRLNADATEMVYTIDLRTNLKFSSGEKITAKDFVFTMLLLASDELQAFAPNDYYNWVSGYEAYRSGEKNVFTGIEILDGNTFTISVPTEYLPYFYEMMYVDITPYPISEIAPGCEIMNGEYGGTYISGDFTSELLYETILNPESGYLTHPEVVSGAYTLASYEEETGKAVFLLNPYYPGNALGIKPEIEEITFIHATYDEALEGLKSGEIDILNKATDGEFINEALEIANGVHSVSYDRQGFGYLAFAAEEENEVTGSLNVRQAIAYCFNRKNLVDDFLRGRGSVVFSHYGLGSWVLNEYDGDIADVVQRYKVNGTRAKQLLIDDGWTLNENGEKFEDGKDKVRYKKLEDGTLIPLELKFAETENNKPAQWITENLGHIFESVGFSFNAEVVPYEDVLKCYYREEGRPYNLMFLATNFDFVYDPYINFNKDYADIGYLNPSGIKDEELSEIAYKMHTTKYDEVEEFVSLWEEFAIRYSEVLPSLPIYSNPYYDFVSDRITGYQPNANVTWAQAIISAEIK